MSGKILQGKTVAFAGSFNQFTSSQAAARARALGARVVPFVSKDVNMLVTGDKDVLGERKSYAREVGAKIVDSSSFIKFVRQGGAEKLRMAKAKMAASTRKRATTHSKSAHSKSAPRLSRSERIKARNSSMVARVLSNTKVAGNEFPNPWEKGYMSVPWANESAGKPKAKKPAAALVQEVEEGIVAAETPKIEQPAAAAAEPAAAPEQPPTSTPASPAVATEQPAAAPVMGPSPPAMAETFVPTLTLNLGGMKVKDNFGNEYVLTPQQLRQMDLAAPTEALPAPTADQKPAEAATEPAELAEAPAKAAAEAVAPMESADKEEAVPEKKAGRSRSIVSSKAREAPDSAPISLRRKTVSFTGTLWKVKRVAAQTMAYKAGALVTVGPLTADTDFLVCGTDCAMRKAAARKMGIKTISEASFIAACGKK